MPSLERQPRDEKNRPAWKHLKTSEVSEHIGQEADKYNFHSINGLAN